MAAPSSSATRAPQPQEHDTACESLRQRFRQFQYEDADGPREAFCKLWELCSQWLKPQTSSVEQILAMLVLEQFLDILPTGAETRMNGLNLETRQRVFTLIEGLQREHGRPENRINIRDMLLEELVSMGVLLTPSNMRVRAPAPQEPQEMSLEEPQARTCDDDSQCKQFLKIDFHLAKDYEYLEPPGEEPPEELLAECQEPVENQNSYMEEMPGTSMEAQALIPGAHAQAGHTGMPGTNAQSGICFAHLQQHNSHLENRSRKVAKKGPGGSTGSFNGSGINGQWLMNQEEDSCECAVGNNPLTEGTSASVPQADYIDEERQQCRLCKREFMFMLGLRENVYTGDSKPLQCSFCGKMFRGQAHLVAHKVTHTKERPFVCEHCRKNYKHKSSLLRHLKSHTSQAFSHNASQ